MQYHPTQIQKLSEQLKETKKWLKFVGEHFIDFRKKIENYEKREEVVKPLKAFDVAIKNLSVEYSTFLDISFEATIQIYYDESYLRDWEEAGSFQQERLAFNTKWGRELEIKEELKNLSLNLKNILFEEPSNIKCGKIVKTEQIKKKHKYLHQTQYFYRNWWNYYLTSN